MNKWMEILVGLVLIIIGVLVWIYSLNWGAWNFGTAAWEFLKGGILWAVLGIGALFILLGISDLK